MIQTVSNTYNSIKLLDASSCIFNSRHFDETKPPRAIRLAMNKLFYTKLLSSSTHPLVINNSHFFNASIATKFFVQVTFLSANAESEDTQHVRRIWRLLGLVNII